MSEAVRIVLVGLGNVNLGLIKILIDKKEAIAEQYNTRFNIVGVVDSSGMAVSEIGFAYEDLVNLKYNKGKVNEITGFLPKAPELIADCIAADLLIDASPVNLIPGNPGLQLIKRAIEKGWHVVFANKAPLVLAFDQLTALAQQHKTSIRYSATVCGGLPVVNVLKRDLKLASLSSLHGVFNATSNFVLQELEKGVAMEEAIKEAQKIGAAETDPTLDISGQDTANKLYLIMKSFSDFYGLIKDIEVEGIEKITAEQVSKAAKVNTQIKLVASAYKKENKWKLEVKPTTVAADSFIGACKGWEMGIEIKSDLYESISFKNYEADPRGTSAAVLRDMIDIQHQ